MPSQAWTLLSKLDRFEGPKALAPFETLGLKAIPELLGILDGKEPCPPERSPRDFEEDALAALVILGKRHPEALQKAVEGRGGDWRIAHVLEKAGA